MRRHLLLAAGLVGLVLSAGCFSPLVPLELIGSAAGSTFFHDRLRDDIDMSGFKLVAGPGFKFGLGFGAAKTGLMIGYYHFEKIGYQGRAAGVMEETGTEIFAPADHHLEAVWGNKELFDMVAEFQKVDGYPSRAALFDEDLTYPQYRFHVPDGFHMGDIDPVSPFPLGLAAIGDLQFDAVAFFGVEFNFSLYQVADYITGWFGFDIAKDDTRNYHPVGPREQ